MSAPAVCLHDVSFAYTGDEMVLREVNLDFEEGSFTCVVGPNGGGKTTLLKLILGLLGPTQGNVRVWGRSPREAADRIGYVPQHLHFDGAFPVTALDVVRMAFADECWWGWYGKEQNRAACGALERVGLEGLEHRLFQELSGGQRQRVLLARALVYGPSLLVLDEPLAGVDAASAERIEKVFQEESSKGKTVVLVSHDLEFVSSQAREVVCVHGVAHRHPTEEVKGPLLEKLFGAYEASRRMVLHDRDLPPTPHRHE